MLHSGKGTCDEDGSYDVVVGPRVIEWEEETSHSTQMKEVTISVVHSYVDGVPIWMDVPANMVAACKMCVTARLLRLVKPRTSETRSSP